MHVELYKQDEATLKFSTTTKSYIQTIYDYCEQQYKPSYVYALYLNAY